MWPFNHISIHRCINIVDPIRIHVSLLDVLMCWSQFWSHMFRRSLLISFAIDIYIYIYMCALLDALPHVLFSIDSLHAYPLFTSVLISLTYICFGRPIHAYVDLWIHLCECPVALTNAYILLAWMLMHSFIHMYSVSPSCVYNPVELHQVAHTHCLSFSV